jgi:UDP-3-O-[3-hydroxymyristoyl] glucosamine N-acyltransferase
VKLRDLADRLHCRLEGDGEIDIVRVAGLEQAEPGDLTFLANPRYAQAARETRASAIILAEDAAPARARCCVPRIRTARSPRPSRCSVETNGHPPACIRPPSSRLTRASDVTSRSARSWSSARRP